MNDKEKERFIRQLLDKFIKHSQDAEYWNYYVYEIDEDDIDEFINFLKESGEF